MIENQRILFSNSNSNNNKLRVSSQMSCSRCCCNANGERRRELDSSCRRVSISLKLLLGIIISALSLFSSSRSRQLLPSASPFALIMMRGHQIATGTFVSHACRTSMNKSQQQQLQVASGRCLLAWDEICILPLETQK